MDYVDELDYWQVKELNMEVKLFLETSSKNLSMYMRVGLTFSAPIGS